MKRSASRMRVALDVRQQKVSPAAARDDYGVVFVDPNVDAVDARWSTNPPLRPCRAELAATRGTTPLLDRGPSYPRLSGGPTPLSTWD